MAEKDKSINFNAHKPTTVRFQTKKSADQTATADQKAPQTNGHSSEKNATKTTSPKKKKWGKVWATTAVLGAAALGAVATGMYYEAQTKEEKPAQATQPSDSVLHCPVLNPAPIKATAIERSSYADVALGLDAEEGFFEAYRDAIARKIEAHLSVGTDLSEATYRATTTMLEGIAHDVNNPPRGVGYGEAKLRTGFPTNTSYAVMLRDVCGEINPKTKEVVHQPKILQAGMVLGLTAEANLNGYSKEDALAAIRTFGGILLDPDLIKNAERATIASPSAVIEAQRKTLRVMSRTAEAIEKGTPAHEAVLYAVEQTFPTKRDSHMAFYTYAKTTEFIAGKTKTEATHALRKNVEEMKEKPKTWWEKNSGLMAGIALGAAAAVALMRRKGR